MPVIVTAPRQGQRVRARFNATILAFGKRDGTAQVEEEDSGIIHYLSLNDPGVLSRDGGKNTGDRISVALTATIASNRLDPELNATTPVLSGGYTHYIYLSSSSITPYEKEAAVKQPYAKGQEIHVEFNALITVGGGPDNTTLVAEETSRAAHYLYLGDQATRDSVLTTSGQGVPRPGAVIKVSFDATIDGDPETGTAATTKVRTAENGDGFRYTHYVYLRSPAVTAIPDPAVPVSYPEGTRVRAEFTATVTGNGDGPFATSTVTEENGITHALFLSTESCQQILVSAEPPFLIGNVIQVAFEGIVKDSRVTLPAGTAKVKTIALGNSGYVHYLNPASPSVTILPDEEEEKKDTEKKEPMSYPVGQKLRVAFSGTVTTVGGERSSTSKVIEDNGIAHYLYLLSDLSRAQVTTSGADSAITVGTRVNVAFTAEVRDLGISTPDGTISVYGPPSDDLADSLQFTHYLNPASPSVTPITDEEEKEEDALPGRTMISPEDDIITSAEVIARITMLRNRRDNLPARYEIARKRTGMIVRSFPTDADAVDYLDTADLRRDRFTVTGRPGTLSDGDAAELAGLSDLGTRGEYAFGQPWNDGSVILRPARYFTATRAREQAVTKLAVDFSQLDQWPLNLINWELAVEAELVQDYAAVNFGSTRYFGKR